MKRVIQLTLLSALPFIFAAIFGWSFIPAHGALYAMAQTPTTDSIVAPNVFTPNGDGENDVFEVKSSDNDEVVSLKIYTRSGVLVFSIEAKLCRWDGRSLSGQPMATGIYYFTAEVRNSSTKPQCGFIHLYR